MRVPRHPLIPVGTRGLAPQLSRLGPAEAPVLATPSSDRVSGASGQEGAQSQAMEGIGEGQGYIQALEPST